MKDVTYTYLRVCRILNNYHKYIKSNEFFNLK